MTHFFLETLLAIISWASERLSGRLKLWAERAERPLTAQKPLCQNWNPARDRLIFTNGLRNTKMEHRISVLSICAWAPNVGVFYSFCALGQMLKISLAPYKTFFGNGLLTNALKWKKIICGFFLVYLPFPPGFKNLRKRNIILMIMTEWQIFSPNFR